MAVLDLSSGNPSTRAKWCMTVAPLLGGRGRPAPPHDAAPELPGAAVVLLEWCHQQPRGNTVPLQYPYSTPTVPLQYPDIYPYSTPTVPRHIPLQYPYSTPAVPLRYPCSTPTVPYGTPAVPLQYPCSTPPPHDAAPELPGAGVVLLEWCHQQPRCNEPIRCIPIPIATVLPRRVSE
jgi:hypothetical protein